MQAAFKLARHSGGLSHYAQVTVIAFSAPFPEIIVAPEVFSWLKEYYGPDAWEWPACNSYREEAVAGCRFALEREPTERSALRVEVKEIMAHPAHTVPEDVLYAACAAVRQAIGSNVDVWPELHSRTTSG